MPDRPDISIIIISTNERKDLERCLDSLERSGQGLALEILVIDNCGQDGVAELVRDRHSQIKLVRNPVRFGFSTNNNIGIVRSTGRYILILNPDTILSDDTLRTMLSYMNANPGVGAAGCKLVNSDGSLQYTARKFPTLTSVICRWARIDHYFPKIGILRDYLMKDYDHDVVREVDWIIGAFLFVRRSVLEEIGPFDQRFDPLYIEDEDLCYRIKKMGYSVHYVPTTTIIHAYNRQSARSIFNRMTYIHFRNFLRFYIKHRRYRG